MSGQTECPETEQLRQLATGLLSEDEQSRLATHLDTCDICRIALEELCAESSLGSALESLADSDDDAGSPELAKLIEELKGAEFPDRAQEQADTETEPDAESEEDCSLDFLEPSSNPDCLGRLKCYEITEVIGCGGMGTVLKARDTRLDRYVAVKALSPAQASNATARKRFVREARATAAVSHSHIVPVYVVDETHRIPFLIMKYVDGRSLQERIDCEGALPVEDILRIGLETASGLAAAHAQGLIHRDINPANILLESGVERVRITDFGLACAPDEVDAAGTGEVTGTPQYMSPEQAGGKALDPRSDLFSLGSAMYAMCTARPAFAATGVVDAIRKISKEAPPPIEQLNPDIPDWLIEIVEKLLAKDPDQRFQSATEVADLLAQHLAHLRQPNTIPRPPRLSGVRPSRRRWRMVAFALVVCFTALAVTEATRVTSIAGLLATLLREQERDSDMLSQTIEDQSVVSSEEESPADDAPVNVGTLNTRYVDTNPTQGKNPLEIIFTSNRPGGVGTFDLYVSRRQSVDSVWQTPTNIGQLNSVDGEYEPTLRFDGLEILFTSVRPGGTGGPDLWRSTRPSADASWLEPVPMAELNSCHEESGVCLSADGLTVYFHSRRPEPGAEISGDSDLFRTSRLDLASPLGAPERLSELNTPFGEYTPALSPDDLTIYFVSQRPGGGGMDIWYATRLTNRSPWSTPTNYTGVNSPSRDFDPFVSFDGRYLFFESDRSTGVGDKDIWMVRLPGSSE